MPTPASIDAIKALTEWWGDMGVEVDDAAVKAYLKVADSAAPPAAVAQDAPVRRPRRKKTDWVEEAKIAAAACDSVEALKAAIVAFEGSPDSCSTRCWRPFTVTARKMPSLPM